MFERESNVQMGDKLLKLNYPKLAVIHGAKYIVLLFLNDVSRIPIVHQMIADNKAIYKFWYIS